MFDILKVKTLIANQPGLTGKQIAKALGVTDKSELNKFLYANSEGLLQKDWKWYLAETDYALELKSPSSWIDERNFEDSLSASGCMLNSYSNRCVIIFPKGCKILLIAGARIIALANQASQLGKSVVLDFSKCSDVRDYLDRLGFFEHLVSEISVLPERPAASRSKQYLGNSHNLVEVAEINLDNFDKDLPKKLTQQFVIHAGKNYYQPVFTIFSELIGNVQEHSETPLPGFVALQLYGGKRPHIQTVISDGGLGIAATLKRNLSEHYPDLYKELDFDNVEADIALVSQALIDGGLSQFGSDPDGAARGLGLKRSQDSASKFDATVNVRQSNFELIHNYKGGNLVNQSINRNLCEINGTQVCFDFYLN